MSFSKAKLKRFNDIPSVVSDSPCCDREKTDRKDSIRKFLRDQFKDDKKTKESKADQILGKNIEVTEGGSQTKTKGFNLFRTPSLPRRLRFHRQHSDLTPKEKSGVAKTLFDDDREKKIKELETVNAELDQKIEILTEYEQIIDEQRRKTHELYRLNKMRSDVIDEKETIINDMEKYLQETNENNKLLQNISEKAIDKIKILEVEIRTILRNHEHELDFIINSNTKLELKCNGILMENERLYGQNQGLREELNNSTDEINFLKITLQNQIEKLVTRDSEYTNLLNDNQRLVDSIRLITNQADEDMLAYVEESKNLLQQLDNLKREKFVIKSKLSEKESILESMEKEMSEIELRNNSERCLMEEKYKNNIRKMTKKYEQQIVQMKEMNDMQLKEIESIHVLERSKLNKDHNETVQKLRKETEQEVNRINELAEDKVRIAEVQAEQKLKALEYSIEQAIEREKNVWKTEIDKCQKIAEHEIMKSEFEKQDLKTLLQSANDLLKEKDHKINDLESQLKKGMFSYSKARDTYDSELREAQMQVTKLMTDKYNYQLTLNNTRSTLNILVDRLKKSDTDVEMFKNELETLTRIKQDLEIRNNKLTAECDRIRQESNEYESALTALRNSSMVLEREVKEQESVFEKLMTSEEETLETVSKIGKMFNERLEENIGKYFELYKDIKKKYESRETYIKDMKSLLDEFATGIELARIELDAKDKKIIELQNENKNYKFEIMTYKYKCEEFERYDDHSKKVSNPSTTESIHTDPKNVHQDDDGLVSNTLIENIISQLERDGQPIQTAEIDDDNKESMKVYSDEEKITVENLQLKEKLMEKTRQVEFLQEMFEMENGHAAENIMLKQKLDEMQSEIKLLEHISRETAEKYNEIVECQNRMENVDQLKESNLQLVNQIHQLQLVNKEQEDTITDLCGIELQLPGTPTRNKLNKSVISTPKTPKSYPGKENNSPAVGTPVVTLASSPKPKALRIRNN